MLVRLKIQRRLKRLPRRPTDLALPLEAALGLLVARLLLAAFPFRVAVRVYRLRPGSSRGPVSAAQQAQAARVGSAIGVAAAHLPWTSTCLTRSVVGAVLLRRRGLGSTIHLGVARTGERRELQAHSWLICGGRTLTGESSRAAHVSVGTYAATAR